MSLETNSSHLGDTEDTAQFVPDPSAVRVTYGAETDRGKVRSRNEDQFLVTRLAKSMRIGRTSLPHHGLQKYARDDGHLFLVADGMGGVAGGEEASRLAVESVEAFVLDALHWFLRLGGKEEAALKSEFREALLRADRAIFDAAEREPRLRGMGTTLTMAYAVGPDVFLAHAGDSRAYLFSGGELTRITVDHTLVQMLVKGGMLKEEEAKTHPRRNIVTNVVGGPEAGVYAEFHKLRLCDGDVLLLCSDGLTEPVEEDRIAEALAQHADDPDAAARHLVGLALDRGGPDNVTAVVARFDFEP